MEKDKELEECKKQKEEYLANWQRARADLLNYKKQEIGRMSEMMALVSESLVLKILPVLDSADEAEKRIDEGRKKDENIKGLLMIREQLKNFLKSQGVEEIEILGKKFDPNLAETVGEIEKEGSEPGIVAEIVQKGYLFRGKVLRPAKVKISK